MVTRIGVESQQFQKLKQDLHNIVLGIISTATKDEQTPPEIVKYLLPFNYQHLFGALFEKLESMPQIMVKTNFIRYMFIKIFLSD